MNRRTFLKTSAAAAAVAGMKPATSLASETPRGRPLKKAIMYATIGYPGSVLDKFKAVKEAGFDGVEPMSHMDPAEVLKAAEATGLELPSVCCQTHWAKPLSHPNPATRREGLDGLKQALRDAKQYGSKSVLLVPGVVNNQISYDEAYVRSQVEIRKAIPLAEELDVVIAIENVWNHFLLSPLEAARYVDELESRLVAWHFDIGNVLRDGWPEQWIRILGKRVVQLHFKEFSVKKRNEEGLRKGFDVDFLEGDNNWPAIMKALDGIRYTGWGIAEQRGGNSAEGLKDLSERMDRIFQS